MRTIVCGGREFADRKLLRSFLSALHADRPLSVIITGGAPGADRLAEEWARHNHVPTIRMDAHWAQQGKKAGVLRNQWMLDLCAPDVVVAFPGGNGTADMMRRTEAANVKLLLATRALMLADPPPLEHLSDDMEAPGA